LRDTVLPRPKVCNAKDDCPESAILAGMQWAAAEQHVKVVNMSLGGEDTPDVDPIEQAVHDLTARYGTLFVVAAGNEGPDGTTIDSPGSADDALTLDARAGKPVTITLPHRDAPGQLAAINYLIVTRSGMAGGTLSADNFDGVYTAQVGGAARVAGFTATVSGQWGQPLNAPYLYSLAWSAKGAFPTGYRRTVAARELATVHGDLGVQAAGVRGRRQAYQTAPGDEGTYRFSASFDYDLPRVTTEYYSDGSGVRWTTRSPEAMAARGRTVVSTLTCPSPRPNSQPSTLNQFDVSNAAMCSVASSTNTATRPDQLRSPRSTGVCRYRRCRRPKHPSTAASGKTSKVAVQARYRH